MLDAIGQRSHDGGIDLVRAREGAVPRVIEDDEDVLAPTPFTLPAKQTDVREVAHRTRDRSGAHRQFLGELGRCHPAVVVDQERREDARRHGREACGGQGCTEPLDDRVRLPVTDHVTAVASPAGGGTVRGPRGGHGRRAGRHTSKFRAFTHL